VRWQIDWTPQAEAHIALHGVGPSEVEEALSGGIAQQRERFGRLRVLGRSTAGRYLAVIVVPVGLGQIRVLTARDMDGSERRLYRRRRQP